MALQMLYQKELGGSEARDVKASFDPFEYLAGRDGDEIDEGGREDGGQGGAQPEKAKPALVRQAQAFANELFDGTLSRLDEIDDLVKSQAENWRLERMPAVDRNILRLAVYELLAELDVPPLVVLDEAIELAKRYGSDQSGAFVNGLLDGLLKRREFASG